MATIRQTVRDSAQTPLVGVTAVVTVLPSPSFDPTLNATVIRPARAVTDETGEWVMNELKPGLYSVELLAISTKRIALFHIEVGLDADYHVEDIVTDPPASLPSSALLIEKTQRVEADETLQGNIDTLADTAQTADVALWQAVNTEATEREAADDALSSRIEPFEALPPLATQAELNAAIQAEAQARQAADNLRALITDLEGLVNTTDPRLSDARPPTGGAGGALSGTYPNPGFAVDMAEQSELDAHTSNQDNPHGVTKAQVGLGNVANVAPPSDSGWILPELEPGVSVASGLDRHAGYRKIGNQVFLHLGVGFDALTAPGQLIFSLPLGFRPVKAFYTENAATAIRVRPDGKVETNGAINFLFMLCNFLVE